MKVFCVLQLRFYLFPKGTRAQWQICFFMSAGMYLLAWITFMIWGASEEREWAKVEDTVADEIINVSIEIQLISGLGCSIYNVFHES